MLGSISKVHASVLSLMRELLLGLRKWEDSMNLHRRDFLLVATLAAAAATPVFGEAVVPTLAPNGGKENATSIPDLSGIWGRWFNLEPPSSGPGPIVSKLRRPDGSIIHSVVGDYTNPILRPRGGSPREEQWRNGVGRDYPLQSP